MDALVGHTGFVGSYLRTKLDGAAMYNSKNIEDMKNGSYGTVYFCGMPAAKWLANMHPGKDLETLETIKGVLDTCTIGRLVLVSTIDVYDTRVSGQNEDAEAYSSEPYGFNRRSLEIWACERFPKVHVLRLPALFGVGLKKNALFDLLTGKQGFRANPLDSFQWYYLDDLWEDIKHAVENDIPVMNLFSEPVKMSDVLTEFFPEHDRESTTDLPGVTYDIRTKYSVTTYIKDKRRIMKQMGAFINLWRCLERARERLVVSNLCWTQACANEARALAVLRRFGISKIEVAVTACQGWNDPPGDIKQRYSGFEVYSMQSLFYGVDCNIFEDSDGFLKHWARVAGVAAELGAKRLVFGSPKNRLVPSGMGAEEARSLFVAAFRRVSDMLDGSIVCIEHNAPEYGCNFVTTVSEAESIVDAIDRKNVMINLDTGNAEMTGCRVSPVPRATCHIQVSAPFLGPIEGDPGLELGAYPGAASMECRGLTPEAFEVSLERFVVAVAAGLPAPS